MLSRLSLALLWASAAFAVRPYGHAFGVPPADFTEPEYAFIAANFPIFTVEKRHAMAVYGDPAAPPTSPFRYNSIAASIGTARKIKSLNPAAKVLMYWNSGLHWNFYEVRRRRRARAAFFCGRQPSPPFSPSLPL
jgi:hypothetical protein